MTELFFKTKGNFYPESLFTEVFGYKIFPILQYKGEINQHTRMVYRWMKSRGGNPIRTRTGIIGYTAIEHFPAIVLNQRMWQLFSPDIYLEYYHLKEEMKEEIIHHGISVLI